ncbi:MAG: hypothetical protein AAF581_10380 [Planctomycetota bacterium]
MAISPKHKRKITIEGVDYLWWVREDDDPPFVQSSGDTLRVAASEGDFFVSYHLGQCDARRHLTVECGVVRGLSVSDFSRFLCPDFFGGTVVRPRGVAALIEWCTSTGSEPLVEVNYLGLPFGDPPQSTG